MIYVIDLGLSVPYVALVIVKPWLQGAEPVCHNGKATHAATPHHEVLWLQQPPHDIKHCGLPDAAVDLAGLVLNRQWCVPGLQEVAARGGNQGGDQAYKVIVHVPYTNISSKTSRQHTTSHHADMQHASCLALSDLCRSYQALHVLCDSVPSVVLLLLLTAMNSVMPCNTLVYPIQNTFQTRIGTAPGYRSVVVEAAITVDTRLLIWAKVGFSTCSRSTAILSVTAQQGRPLQMITHCIVRQRSSSHTRGCELQ